ncbi:unnamed protein product [Rhizophagus irregularis]|uniref:Uncharacterized protein n=1 Tax=Rhizophagus irregularis TaxID=588596 RepID=A0A2I1HJS4_9GLOM|nr:hypothetical protein RhiirA4_481632 [Rhizophagus irregularis]CAB4425830.1 unnamed protein product [Rhizophagus irregularis]
MDSEMSRISQLEASLTFIAEHHVSFHENVTQLLSSLIQDGFLQSLFDKTPSKPVDKAQLLIDRFGEAADPANFTLQAQATNIQPTTLSLLFSTALYVSSRSWENFASKYYMTFGDMGDLGDSDTDDELGETSAQALDKDEIHRIIDAKISNLGLQTPNTA